MGRWEDATLGERFGPLDLTISPELHDRWVRGARNERPEVRDVVEPSAAGNLSISVIGSRYPGPIIHTHQDLAFYGTVKVGDTVVGTGTLSLKETRRGKAYVAVDCDFTRRADGERVWWARMTCVWPEVHLGETPTVRSAPATAVAPDGVPTLRRDVTQDDMTLYSGPGNIHSDIGVARTVGLDATIAQGVTTLAYASELLTSIHGGAWLERGEIAAKFIAPVYAGDTVTVWVDREQVGAVNRTGALLMTATARLRS